MALPVLSVAEMREWERVTWASGMTEAEVIYRVGKALAAWLCRHSVSGDRLLLLAGKGHNGDDVRAAAPFLNDRTVELLNVTDSEASLHEVEAALVRRPRWVVDGLFGIGLSRPLEGGWRKLVERINQSGLAVVAMDVPSGLNADTGKPLSEAVRAQWTLTVGAPKGGFLWSEAAEYVGRVEVLDDVGFVPPSSQSELWWNVPGDFAGLPPVRSVNSHKGTYGHVVIFAGSLGYHGAAVLAARAAQRARPGLVTLVVPPEVYFPVAGQLASVMVQPWKPGWALPRSTSSILFGPGMAVPDLSQELRWYLMDCWRKLDLPIIADASALDWFREAVMLTRSPRIITPHPGEAARLTQHKTAYIQSHRLESVREMSRAQANAWVILKGHQTLIGRQEGIIHVNSSGNPGLAQGGSGDVLAGFLVGLVAQSVLQADLGRTLRYAVWEHGHVADLLEAEGRNWTIEDLLTRLGK